ncbi:MAG: hypothetical protein KME21_03745 [Desmonostoc vinosum HA7617-LM4]|nr:hypothetical protein [Desmonostoc vinosum HA7617-LM4]
MIIARRSGGDEEDAGTRGCGDAGTRRIINNEMTIPNSPYFSFAQYKFPIPLKNCL